MRYNLQHIIYLSLLVIVSIPMSAKKRVDSLGNSVYRNTVSINFSDPILKVLSKTNSVIDSSLNLKSPILYIGKQYNKMNYRVGLRAYAKNNVNSSDLLIDKKYERFNRFDVNFLASRRKTINSFLEIGYGPYLSAFVVMDQKIFDSGFDKVTFDNMTFSGSAGMNFMLKYNINSRLSVFTEYVLAYQYIQSSNKVKFSVLPEENYAREKSREHGIQFDYPISLYITYHF